MAAGVRRHQTLFVVVALADLPSLDPHQESTFANIQLVAPLYSTLLQIDPYSYPTIIGDVATEWTISPDGLTYAFKIRQGVRFHDGSPLTAADVKATYDKIVFPPEGVRNPDYVVRDRPYLDGYKFFISPETSVRAAAIRSGRAHIEFRDLPNAEVEAIKKQLGDKILVQTTPMTGQFGIAINSTAKPFTDVRVRKALTLGLDRYTAGKVLYGITGLKLVGGLMRPGSEWALPDAELQKLPGFWKDAEKSRAEARRLLAEAGYPNGFKAVLKNRNVKLPYQDFAVFAIQEWRKIGVEVENRPLETAAWFNDGQNTGNFELIVAPTVEYMDDPDQFLGRYVTGSTQNWGRYSDPGLDDLFARQARALDHAEREKLIREIQKVVLENAYYMPGLWWMRNVVHWAKVKNYVAPPSHYTNQKLQDVWLAGD